MQKRRCSRARLRVLLEFCAACVGQERAGQRVVEVAQALLAHVGAVHALDEDHLFWAGEVLDAGGVDRLEAAAASRRDTASTTALARRA